MIANDVRCALISDFTLGGLAPLLADPADPPVFATFCSPFGQVMQSLVDETADAWQFRPDFAVVWTRPEAVIRSYGLLKDGELVSQDELSREVDQYADVLRVAAGRVKALFVPSWTSPAYDRGLGILSLSPRVGPAYHLSRMNMRLAEAVESAGSIHVLDAGRWCAAAGLNGVSPKLWHLGKIAFGPEILKHAARDVKAAVRAVQGRARKLIVLDLDDTLWGGIVGEVGWENVVLGGHHPVGEAFCDFQRALKALAKRGILLAICSKNESTVALDAIDRHPDMILRRDHFAGWRINWQDKVQNVIDLLGELNLGPDAAVFIDDSPSERARVRQALPDVLVPEWPADKLLYKSALVELNCFDSLDISEEDRARTRMYVSERQRQEMKSSAQSLGDYLESLRLRVTVEQLSPANLKRAAQLLNKTNQMNLRTRRMTEAELAAWARAAGNAVYVFRVSDRFDDYGLTGLGSLTVADGTARVADFVLSCRVMGRGIEQSMLHTIGASAGAHGAERLILEYLPTPRNSPCKEFLNHSGLNCEDDTYSLTLAEPYPAPAHVVIEHSASPEKTFA